MTSIPSPRSKRHARIEIIPLIDIVFFLLATFVMVSLSMVKNQGISVHLPSARTGVAQDHAESTTISITGTGEVFFNKQLIGMPRLETSLRELIAQNPDPRVFINGDAKAEFGTAITVLDAVRKLGITKVAIQTQSTQKPPSSMP
jgi:biopolymer transport protein ExbD